jgi:pimeloyl-ACP methyl ester carboxylesterase
MTTHQTAKTSYVQVDDVKYAYRKLGKPNAAGIPLLILHHFRGTMDFWDPLFVNLFMERREVILFDNAGVGQSTGEIPDSISAMATHVYRFIQALKLPVIDLYGFSMGGLIAQQLVLEHPKLVRKLCLSGTGPGAGPSGAPHITNPNEAKVGELATTEVAGFEEMYPLFFYPTETSKVLAQAYWKRVGERSIETSGEERTKMVTGAGIMAQGTALGKWGGGEGTSFSLVLALYSSNNQNTGSFDRLSEIKTPTLVTNGRADFMIPTANSFVMSQGLPNATLIVYPDSGHGHCFQFPELHNKHVTMFLDGIDN